MGRLDPDKLRTLGDFRGFFAAIPEDQYVVGTFQVGSRCCASGFLGQRMMFDPSLPVIRLREELEKVWPQGESPYLVSVNDGCDDRFPQATPKARVLAMLDASILRKEP